VNDHRRNNEFVVDILTSEGPRQGRAQVAARARLVTDLIDALTEPEELIVDPFAGSGLWGRIAVSRKRRWIGCDIEQGGATRVA
jgi:hypothetical protein